MSPMKLRISYMNKSLQRAAKDKKVYSSTAHRATRALQLHPYCIQVTLELKIIKIFLQKSPNVPEKIVRLSRKNC